MAKGKQKTDFELISIAVAVVIAIAADVVAWKVIAVVILGWGIYEIVMFLIKINRFNLWKEFFCNNKFVAWLQLLGLFFIWRMVFIYILSLHLYYIQRILGL